MLVEVSTIPNKTQLRHTVLFKQLKTFNLKSASESVSPTSRSRKKLQPIVLFEKL